MGFGWSVPQGLGLKQKRERRGNVSSHTCTVELKVVVPIKSEVLFVVRIRSQIVTMGTAL